MIRIEQTNFGKGINRTVYRDDKIIATIAHHPEWGKPHVQLPDAWSVNWTTGRVDWHMTLADARDNALKGL